MRTILVTLALLAVSTATLAATKGQDRSGSQCERTNKDGSKTNGSCGTACKDLDIKTATGDAQASGVQYVCAAAARRVTPSRATTTRPLLRQ
jgi:hypothetical protein